MFENQKHNEKMKKLKTSKQKIFAKKTEKKGLIIVNTGTGKGKSTAAFGMVFRGIAHGMPCAVVQFIKGAMATGERDLIQHHFHELCEFHTLGDGFTWDTQDKEKDIASAKKALMGLQSWASSSMHLQQRYLPHSLHCAVSVYQTHWRHSTQRR